MWLGVILMAPCLIIVAGALLQSWVKRQRYPTASPEERRAHDRASRFITLTGELIDTEADQKPPRH